jgi:hypothetical protein
VAKTAPYYHDGGIAELGAAVRSMATHQLGIELAPRDQDAILAFLDALTGIAPAGYSEKPELPPDADALPASRKRRDEGERLLAVRRLGPAWARPRRLRVGRAAHRKAALRPALRALPHDSGPGCPDAPRQPEARPPTSATALQQQGAGG